MAREFRAKALTYTIVTCHEGKAALAEADAAERAIDAAEEAEA